MLSSGKCNSFSSENQENSVVSAEAAGASFSVRREANVSPPSKEPRVDSRESVMSRVDKGANVGKSMQLPVSPVSPVSPANSPPELPQGMQGIQGIQGMQGIRELSDSLAVMAGGVSTLTHAAIPAALLPYYSNYNCIVAAAGAGTSGSGSLEQPLLLPFRVGVPLPTVVTAESMLAAARSQRPVCMNAFASTFNAGEQSAFQPIAAKKPRPFRDPEGDLLSDDGSE